MISILYYLAIFVFTVFYLFPFSLLFAMTVLFDKQRAILHHASRLWSKAIFMLRIPRHSWRVEVDGLEGLDCSKPYVVITNHQSMLDIPLLYGLPFNFKWVSKREVYKIPIFGLVLRMHGDIAIERGAASSAKKMVADGVKCLHEGTSVIIFPEGTRTQDGKIHKFKDGAFMLAKHAGVGILPCVIDGTASVMNGWQIRTPHTFKVKVLREVSAQRVAQSDVKDLATELNAIMTEAHKAMTGALYE